MIEAIIYENKERLFKINTILIDSILMGLT